MLLIFYQIRRKATTDTMDSAINRIDSIISHSKRKCLFHYQRRREGSERYKGVTGCYIIVRSDNGIVSGVMRVSCQVVTRKVMTLPVYSLRINLLLR